MARVWLALLGLIATLLVVGSAPPDGERPDLDAASAALPVGQEWVSAKLRQVNPALSEPELQRIGVAVMRCSDERGLPPELVTAVLRVESAARPWARSPKGAVGLMQVMPHMFAPYEVAGNATTIETNIEVGCAILADNIHRLGEDEGILAYFWGSDIRGVSYLERVRAARTALGAGSRS